MTTMPCLVELWLLKKLLAVREAEDRLVEWLWLLENTYNRHCRIQLLCRMPQALGKGRYTFGKAFV